MGCGSSTEKYATSDYGQYLAKAAAEEARQAASDAAEGVTQVTQASPSTVAPSPVSSPHGAHGGNEVAREKLQQALRFRKKYLQQADPQRARATSEDVMTGKVMVMVDGVAEVPGLELPSMPSRHEFKYDLIALWKIVKDPECKSCAMNRLHRLSVAFQSYDLEQADQERHDQAEIMGDLYSVMKVDNHIHLAAAMTPRQLLAFIKEKLELEPEREVVKGKTLKRLLMEAVRMDETSPGGSLHSLEAKTLEAQLHVDALRTVADDHFYHRFDNFNDAYSPLGCGDLRTVFLKSSNFIQGSYFGELAQAVIGSFHKNDTFAEMRMSIYGKNLNEWDDLARWLKSSDLHGPAAASRNLWMIQIPRVFGAFHKAGLVSNFEELLNNIFQPLFEVALDPASHADLAEVLPVITGVDSVDDESVPDQLCARRSQLYSEGQLLPSEGDVLRPQLWAAGEVHHLATTFLLAEGINHGVNLQHSPVLQYLYFLTQIGISVSPLSNNALFLKMSKNPFPEFFQRGLNVTLSTDDPLMFHTTKEPLLEEYTTARAIYGLSGTDMCEIAGNSVRQSSFAPRGHPAAGSRVLGTSRGWHMDTQFSNIPQRRLNYRRRCLAKELSFLRSGVAPAKDVPTVPEIELDWLKLDL